MTQPTRLDQIRARLQLAAQSRSCPECRGSGGFGPLEGKCPGCQGRGHNDTPEVRNAVQSVHTNCIVDGLYLLDTIDFGQEGT